DEVRAVQRVGQVRGRVHRGGPGRGRGELGQDVTDDLEPLLGDVVEPQLGDAQPGVAGGQGLEDLGDAEPAPADYGELHAVTVTAGPGGTRGAHRMTGTRRGGAHGGRRARPTDQGSTT